jgi:hypothetical protein
MWQLHAESSYFHQARPLYARAVNLSAAPRFLKTLSKNKYQTSNRGPDAIISMWVFVCLPFRVFYDWIGG